MMGAHDATLTEQMVNSVFEVLDADKSGQVSFEEYLAALIFRKNQLWI